MSANLRVLLAFEISAFVAACLWVIELTRRIPRAHANAQRLQYQNFKHR